MSEEKNTLIDPEEASSGDAETTADEAVASEAVPSNAPDQNKKKAKKKRKPYVDDGHTVYDMSALDDPRERAARRDPVSLTRGEKWAVIRAAFMRYAPPMLLTILGFLAAMLLIRLWLHV